VTPSLYGLYILWDVYKIITARLIIPIVTKSYANRGENICTKFNCIYKHNSLGLYYYTYCSISTGLLTIIYIIDSTFRTGRVVIMRRQPTNFSCVYYV